MSPLRPLAERFEGAPYNADLGFQIETIEPDRVKTIEELNKEYAEKVLDMLGGNKSKAAEVLGISRTSLWRILKEE